MCPGLDSRIVSKNPPTHVMATVKIHMKQEIQNIQSTKKQPPQQTIKKSQEDKETKDHTFD